MPAGAAAAERARQVADEVLARAEYASARPSLLERALGWVFEQIGRLLALLFGSSRASLLGTLVILLMLVAAGMLISRFARNIRRDPRAGGLAVAARHRGAAQWRAEAVAAERARQWREALRCRYRELLADLAAAGLVDEVPGRTTGEYLAEVRANLPAAAEAFASITRAFEFAWYGRRPVNEGELKAAVESAVAVRASLARTRPTAAGEAGARGRAAAGVR